MVAQTPRMKDAWGDFLVKHIRSITNHELDTGQAMHLQWGGADCAGNKWRGDKQRLTVSFIAVCTGEL